VVATFALAFTAPDGAAECLSLHVVIETRHAGSPLEDAFGRVVRPRRTYAGGETPSRRPLFGQRLPRRPLPLDDEAKRTYVRVMVTHAYEAHCECGAVWRVYADGNDDDPMGTCVSCGADTYDLRDIGEFRHAGSDTDW
jgi:hypothetical protein